MPAGFNRVGPGDRSSVTRLDSHEAGKARCRAGLGLSGIRAWLVALTVTVMECLSEPMDSPSENVVAPLRIGAVNNVELRQVCDLPEGDDFSQQKVGPTTIDRLLFDGFLRQRRRSRGPLVALNERLMIANASAAEYFVPSDRPRLWAAARELLRDDPRPKGEFLLGNGVRVLASYRALLANGQVVGALIQLSLPLKSRSLQQSGQSLPTKELLVGWWSLTDSERAVAELVAEGLTNREAGRRVYLSRHTVDSHLRQIFRKLNITSRVELARIAGEHSGQLHDMQLAQATIDEVIGEADMVLRAQPERALSASA